jgi:hypothetical protein
LDGLDEGEVGEGAGGADGTLDGPLLVPADAAISTPDYPRGGVSRRFPPFLGTYAP